jgi:predicted HTH domain antitoxin
MASVNLELEDEILNLLLRSGKPAEQAAREMIVLELYRRQAIAIGKASELLRMSEQEFTQYAHSFGIAFDAQEPQTPSERLAALIKQRFPPEGKAERIARSLAALNRVVPTSLSPEDLRWIAEDPDIEDQF